VAKVPAAFAAWPTAVESPPVAPAAAQVPEKPVFVEAHCAKAGAPPKTVTIPAATARPRKVPPAMALAPMRRARRLIGMPIGSFARAMSWMRERLWTALTVLVRTTSPPALRCSMAAAPVRATKANSTTPIHNP